MKVAVQQLELETHLELFVDLFIFFVRFFSPPTHTRVNRCHVTVAKSALPRFFCFFFCPFGFYVEKPTVSVEVKLVS